MNHTAEEVRAIAKRLHDDITVADGDALMAPDMLTAYAERIKADEESAVGYVATDNKIVFYVEDGWSKEVPPGTKLFTHPPAQAAQVDPAAKPRTLADFVNAPDAERARTGQQVAARVDEMMAEPVAQGESGVIRHVGDSRFESWFSEYVVGQNGAKQQARDAYGAGLAEQAERLAAQPAQSVDVEKVREVIEEIAEQWHGCMYDAPGETVDISDAIRRTGTRLITAALQEKGNG